jgi:hypothetical protein
VRRASLLLILLSLALVGTGCGSSDSDPATGGLPDEAELEGETPAELKIASEVQRYLGRNCGTPGAVDKVPDKYLDDPHYAPYIHVLEADENMCGQMASIEVEGMRVTIRSDIEPEKAKAAGHAFCLLIWGSDVADETPGHELQDLEGRTIKRCHASY